MSQNVTALECGLRLLSWRNVARIDTNSAFCCSKEGEHGFGWNAVEPFLGGSDSLAEIHALAEQGVVKGPLFEFEPFISGHSGPAQPTVFSPQMPLSPRAMVKGGRSLLIAEPPCINARVPTRTNW